MKFFQTDNGFFRIQDPSSPVHVLDEEGNPTGEVEYESFSPIDPAWTEITEAAYMAGREALFAAADAMSEEHAMAVQAARDAQIQQWIADALGGGLGQTQAALVEHASRKPGQAHGEHAYPMEADL